MSPREFAATVREAFVGWQEDKATSLGAALAYYGVFAIAPLFVIAIAVAGFVFGEQAAEGRIVREMSATLGETTARAVERMVASARDRGTGVSATVIGVIMLLSGATAVFGQLQDALNTVWKVAPRPGRGVWGLIRDRFLSFAMVLGIGFLLLLSLALTAVLAALGQWTASWSGGADLWRAANAAASFAIVTLLFAMIFKVLPDVHIHWRDVWIGAAVTALLFTGGKYLLGAYFAHGGVTSVYGAAGSLVAVLLWVYYSSQIVLFGAEFTRAYAHRHGSCMEPTENAVAVNR